MKSRCLLTAVAEALEAVAPGVGTSKHGCTMRVLAKVSRRPGMALTDNIWLWTAPSDMHVEQVSKQHQAQQRAV